MQTQVKIDLLLPSIPDKDIVTRFRVRHDGNQRLLRLFFEAPKKTYGIKGKLRLIRDQLHTATGRFTTLNARFYFELIDSRKACRQLNKGLKELLTNGRIGLWQFHHLSIKVKVRPQFSSRSSIS